MLRDGIWHRRYGGDKETFEAVCLCHGLDGFLTCCLTAYLVPAVIRLVGCDANS
jgi:hypothetical protein